MYDACFPKVKIKLKPKRIFSPWITNGIAKSSRQKQKLYDKFLKNRTRENEIRYKTYKNLFESIKTKSKKMYYSNKLLKYKDDARKTWSIMKDIIGKAKISKSFLPPKIRINNTEIFEKEKIANEFNQYFTNVGPDLAKHIPTSSTHFEDFIKKTDSLLPVKAISMNEFKEACYSLKTNKSPGHDDICFNVIKQCFGELNGPLKLLFDLSLSSGIFPDNLKIAKITPIFKSGDTEYLGNYRPISVLPCFSKILERIMYNRVYNFLKRKIFYMKNNLDFKKATLLNML